MCVVEVSTRLCLALIRPFSFTWHARPISCCNPDVCIPAHLHLDASHLQTRPVGCCRAASVMQPRSTHPQGTVVTVCGVLRCVRRRYSLHIWVLSQHAKCHPSGHKLAPQSCRLQTFSFFFLYHSDSKAWNLMEMQNKRRVAFLSTNVPWKGLLRPYLSFMFHCKSR